MKDLDESSTTCPERQVPSGRGWFRWSLGRMMLAVAACALLVAASKFGLFWFSTIVLGAVCGAVLTRATPMLQAFGGVAGGIVMAFGFLLLKSVELWLYPDTHQSQYLPLVFTLYAIFGTFAGFSASAIDWILGHSAWLGVRPGRVDGGGSVGGGSATEG